MTTQDALEELAKDAATNRNSATLFRLIESRNCQSHTLREQAKELLRQAAEVDLSNIASVILLNYPQIHSITLVEDQRRGYEGTIFAGHVDDEKGNKIDASFEAKNFIEKLVSTYDLADPEFVTNRFINLREYAAKSPVWFHSVAESGITNFKPVR